MRPGRKPEAASKLGVHAGRLSECLAPL
jgi:hypothetical protein